MNKINFNFEEHKNKNEVVHCKTQEEANLWCKFMYNNGLKWCDDMSYLEDNHWCIYKERTCYFFNEGSVGSKDLYIKNDYTIIEFSSLINSKKVKL